MYINAQLQTCSIPTPGSVPLTDDLAEKLRQYRNYGKAVTDEEGNLIDIEYDEEKAAEIETERAAERLERNLEKARKQRDTYLQAFDCYKSNLIYFGGEETEAEHAEIVEWYNSLLNITDGVTAEAIPDFPDAPAGIRQYL